MELAMIGLGKMGGNMTERLLRGGHRVIAYDRNPEAVQGATAAGAVGVTTLEELVQQLSTPRVIWIMVPAGAPVDSTIAALQPMLQAGDILIDGGNSLYKDTQKRAAQLKEHGIAYLDAGTSGGIWGLSEGYCLMVGGEREAVAHVEPIMLTLAPEGGYAHVGPSGAGHFTKMIHNGIEYGMMQAYAEGFEILKSKTEMNLDLHQISALWNHGSVVRSWLLELAEQMFAAEPDLASIKDWVADSGEGRWTVQEAIDQDVPAPVITLSLMRRFESRQDESFANKVVAGLRHQFGGHAVKRES
ncbi:MAG: decarboxylating 6-phosphogluconate dehydrogenase [Chloroflexi bacterium]|nr:decarboxylating 6-phosphogluconate dehydrogenase [Chloroflexota bacterium]